MSDQKQRPTPLAQANVRPTLSDPLTQGDLGMTAPRRLLAKLLSTRMERFAPSQEMRTKTEIGNALIRLAGQVGGRPVRRADHQAIAGSFAAKATRGGT